MSEILTNDDLLAWIDAEESYCRRRAAEEKDQFLKAYWYEKSMIYDKFHQKVRNLK